MAEQINTRPQEVDITHYGGDTLTIRVTAPDSLVSGMEWNAQVRANRDPATPVDASFICTAPAAPGDPGILVLSSVDTARLAGSGTVVRKRVGNAERMIQTYTGVWDCQISDPVNPDPVTTLVQGTVAFDMDVTRLP